MATIPSKEVEDGGWWKGELDGTVGVFPENFVRLTVTDNSDKKPCNCRPPQPASLPSTYSENVVMVRDGNEIDKRLSKSLSFEEKYGLASLKKLSETSISKNKARSEKQTTKRLARRKEKGSKPEMFDSISSSKLTHTTAGRVKAPKRKPPSQHLLKENVRIGDFLLIKYVWCLDS